MATQETIKQLFSGGVLRDIEDVTARQMVAALQNAIDALTSGDTTTAIETFQEVIDFLSGVTDDETLIGKITALQTSINAKYSKPSTGIPATDLAEGVIPDVSGKANKSEMSVVDGTGANADKTTITLKTGTSATVLKQHQDISDLATKTELAGKVDKEKGKGLSTEDYTTAEQTKLQDLPTNAQLEARLQSIVAGESIVFGTDEAPIIDDPNSADADTVLGAASARWVKEIDNNVKAILAALANIAFTNGKPNWQAVAKRKYNLTMTALTGCSGTVVSGDAGNGQVYEGGLRIKLTPTSSSYAFTSVLVNGESVTPVATGDADGSVYVDVIVNQDITLTATAVSGYGVSLASGSNCSLLPESVVPNGTYYGTLKANPHYNLPSTISATMNGNDITFDGTTNSYDPLTNPGAIKISNVTGAVVITASATLQNKITVTLNGTNVKFYHDGVELTGGSVDVYEGDKPYIISIKPTEGNAIGSAPTTTGVNSPVSDGEGGYTLTVDSNESSDFAITAAASVAHNVNVVVKRITGLTEYAGNAGVSPDMTITDDATTGTSVSNAAPVQDSEQFSGTVNPGSGFGIFSVKVMMGTTDISSTAYNPVTRAISIASVTDDLTITVTVREAVNGMFNGVSLHARKGSGNSGWVDDKAGILVKDDDFSAMADFVELPSSAVKVRWVYGGIVVSGSDLSGDLPSWQRTMIFYKDGQVAFGYLTMWEANQTQRDCGNTIKDYTIDQAGNQTSTIKYIRASFKTEFLSGAAIQYYDGSSWDNYLWRGPEHIPPTNNE